MFVCALFINALERVIKNSVRLETRRKKELSWTKPYTVADNKTHKSHDVLPSS